VTVSRDLAPAPTAPAPTVPRTVGAPSPRTPREPDAVVVPAQSPPGTTTVERLRRAVTALRHATRDGSVHHHRHPGVPRSRRAPEIEVVRAWADGRDLGEQRRACRACTPEAAAR
jgi:hypothetical protein